MAVIKSKENLIWPNRGNGTGMGYAKLAFFINNPLVIMGA